MGNISKESDNNWIDNIYIEKIEGMWYNCTDVEWEIQRNNQGLYV